MSEEAPKRNGPPPAKFYIMPDHPPIQYITGWGARVGDSDVVIVLGSVMEQTDEEQVVKESLRIALTHDGFIKFVGALDNLRDFLKEAYGGAVPSLSTIPPDVLEAATKKLAEQKQ